MITAELDGLDDLVRDLHQFRSLMGLATRKAVQQGVDAGASEARSNHTWHSKGGDADRNTIGLVTASNKDESSGWFGCLSEHASFLENGTKAHWIRPKAGFYEMGPLKQSNSRQAVGQHKRKYLHWTDGSGEHFAKEVWHPGTTGTFWLRRCIPSVFRVMNVALEAEAERLAKEMGLV